MIEFTVSDQTYRASRMNAMTQFHVTRRLTPALAKFGDILPKLAAMKPDEAKDVGREVAMTSIATLGEAFGSVMNELSDEDAEYVIYACLAVCERKGIAPGTWAKILILEHKALMFQDIGLPEMLAIASKVLQDQLANFFSGLSSAFRLA